MQRSFSVADLRLDQKVENVPFALKEFEKKTSRQGKPYYNINLGDKTGEIRGKIWQESFEHVDEKVQIGGIVKVSGLVQEYADKPQIIVESLELVKDMAPEEFLPATSRDRSQMISEVEEKLNNIKDPHLKKLVDIFWQDENWRDRYINFPAAEYVHHAYVGGIIEHTWEMINLAEPFYKLYPQLNRDLLTVGVFFHDVGKLEELDIVGAAIIRTTAGRLVAHIGQGLLLVDKFVAQVDNFPGELKNKLYHLILSHQGHLEYGSPVLPQTLEALVLSFIDTNSADMNQATKHIEKEMETGNEFTDYHKWLRRSLYQKDFL